MAASEYLSPAQFAAQQRERFGPPLPAYGEQRSDKAWMAVGHLMSAVTHPKMFVGEYRRKT